MTSIAKDVTTVNIPKDMIELIRLVLEPTVIGKDVTASLPMLGLGCNIEGGVSIGTPLITSLRSGQGR